ncbi:MAG: rod shape-determining protein RodA [Gracilimonas sp.]|uniref:Rod shape-determining protein RodA n=1 Tax=Gracilimonas sediminicola TaxID=2952158 RepID=A0A9X2L488_9BACT|nr:MULTISPECIES: rod shape-determining protein RodA [Gracilimonas]MBO6586962.1 rod shape-determining protein RodA [Gracilimonas sp.]MBO6614550.1 rod shape-determining protein RodA [Gracilimonas sp.]MCP9292007.1 rod shape-determining protein RodA [Gracilimonas sediminicola]
MNNIREFSWSVVFAWVVLFTIGIVAIYSATQGPVSQFLPEYIQDNFYKQLIFVSLSVFMLAAVQLISPRNFIQLSYAFYAICLVLMVITLYFGTEVNGAKSWLRFGPFNLQTSELMKIATILATANYLTSRRDISAENVRYAVISVIIILIPTILVFMQNDLGTALIFLTLIPVMLFWSGLPYGVSLFIISPAIIAYLSVIEWYYGVIAAVILTAAIFFIQRRVWLSITSLITGLLTTSGVQLALTQLLQPHQIARIAAFTNPAYDPTGAGWNVIQAKTAIGSGGLTGKGFLEGTQTQLKFLPEQWTDFIFCVIGEEFGFVGAAIVIITFLFLFIRLLNMAGSHKHPFAQLVTVSVASVFFVHFFINVGSASALLPVIGLPLPFVSYGGSAFITNTLMLAICLNMDFYKRDFSIYR